MAEVLLGAETNDAEVVAGRELHHAALRIEKAWLEERTHTPASDRKPLETELEFNLALTESQYAAGVLDLLEEAGAEEAFEQVIRNRAALSAYRDLGAEPW
jgi:hypothetical protein